LFKYIEIFTLFFVLIFSAVALAAESPDELYKHGSFAEAEKAYTHLDMDHPKDIRFRYNRACAAYQNSDYKGATAAFSSVLRRTKDSETRFRTAYNLGNTAFKQGDFASAVAYYKQAITCNPENKDAGYNLELALIQQEKQKQEQKKNKTKDQKKQSRDGSSQPQDKENKSKGSKEGKDSDKQSQGKTSEQKASQGRDQQDKKNRSESNRKGGSKQEKNTRQNMDQKAGQESPKDLSGDLKPLQAMPEEGDTGGDKSTGQAMSAIDRKKAESLLDNLKEDRSRFMRLQVPKNKRYGVQSGKDW